METSTEGAAEARGEAAAQPDPQAAAGEPAAVAVPEAETGTATGAETLLEPTASSGDDTATAAVSEPEATRDAVAEREPQTAGTDRDEAAVPDIPAIAEAQDTGADGADASVEGTVSTPGDPGAAAALPPVAVPPASLSPSRASDFMQCPLLYRFRVIDRLPEKPSEAATRGTLVHAVLERLFDAPAGERTAPRAKALVPGQWDRLRENRPEVVELFEDDPGGERLARWLGEAEQLVERWFTLEDPTRLEPAERELFVEAELDSGLRLRGIIDRVDVAPTGEVRIVDYKTGKAPRPEYAEGALFQMKFYALVVWRLKRVVPRRLQLVYLGSGDVLTYDPVLADLERVERKLLALWEAIRQATESGDWRPRPTKLCGWCDHQTHCPEFGGTPPPYPLPVRAVRSVDVAQGRMGPD